MKKTVLKTIFLFCLVVSCKTNETSNLSVDECELFKIGNFVFHNPRVYERPIILEKGSHSLLHKDYVPVWYAGYCTENLPSYFKSEEEFVKHIHSKNIEKKSLEYYKMYYSTNKKNLTGLKSNYHKDFHLLFRGTVSAKNLSSGNEYLLVAGKSFISQESDYDKNTDFYENNVKNMLAFLLEDGIYKAVNIDYVLGTFTKEQHDKVFNILNTRTLMNTICFENVNTIKKPNFNSLELPRWVYNKSELDE